MAGNQMAVRKIGEAGYGKNKKPPTYIKRNSAGVPESQVRILDGQDKRDAVFDSGNEVRGL